MAAASFSLLLDVAAVENLPDQKRPVFVYEWLRWLDKTLPRAPRAEVKEKQKQLVGQLMDMVQQGSLGPQGRNLAAKCLTTLFSVGDTFLLFDTINK